LILFGRDVKLELSLSGRRPIDHPTMNGKEHKEDWLKLCEQAAVERDPEKLVALTREICRLLEEKENLLRNGGRS
jgi:hypothetical protein